MEPLTVSVEFSAALDKLRAAVGIMEAHGEEAAQTARDLIQQAYELLA